MQDTRTRQYRAAVTKLIIGASIISFSPVFVKLAHIGPTMAGFYRTIFGGAFLLIVVLVRRDALWRGGRPLLWAAAAGTAFAADLTFWHRAII